jgi:hypothetical protein
MLQQENQPTATPATRWSPLLEDDDEEDDSEDEEEESDDEESGRKNTYNSIAVSSNSTLKMIMTRSCGS